MRQTKLGNNSNSNEGGEKKSWAHKCPTLCSQLGIWVHDSYAWYASYFLFELYYCVSFSLFVSLLYLHFFHFLLIISTISFCSLLHLVSLLYIISWVFCFCWHIILFSSSFTFHHFLADFLAFSLSLTIIVISLSHSLSCSRFFVFIRVIKYPSSLYISNYSQYSLFPHSLCSLITLFPCLFATFLHSTTRLSLSTY